MPAEADALCAVCNAPERPNRMTYLSARAYCGDCFAEASRVSVAAGFAQPRGTFTVLEISGESPPLGAEVGSMWYDTLAHELRYCVRYDFNGSASWAVVTGPGQIKLPEPDPEPLKMYVIYKNPSDFDRRGGDIYVLRRWLVGVDSQVPDDRPITYGPNLEEVRAHVPPGLIALGRALADDPAILETWF